jgi:hypothetical protein
MKYIILILVFACGTAFAQQNCAFNTGTNTSTPSVQCQSTMGSAGNLIQQSVSSDASKAPFGIVEAATNFDGTYDWVRYQGYNAGSGGGPILSTEPTLYWAMEQDYLYGGTHFFEHYLSWIPAGSTTQVRPIFFQFNRGNGLIVTAQAQFTSFQIINNANAGNNNAVSNIDSGGEKFNAPLFIGTGNVEQSYLSAPVGDAGMKTVAEFNTLNSAYAPAIGILSWSSAYYLTPTYACAHSKSGTFGVHGASSAGDYVCGLESFGSDGTHFVRATGIYSIVDGSVSSSVVPGRIEFWTSGTAGAGTKAATIDSTQNLTIPALKSITGTRFVCADTNGKLVSQATACSGT